MGVSLSSYARCVYRVEAKTRVYGAVVHVLERRWPSVCSHRYDDLRYARGLFNEWRMEHLRVRVFLDAKCNCYRPLRGLFPKASQFAYRGLCREVTVDFCLEGMTQDDSRDTVRRVPVRRGDDLGAVCHFSFGRCVHVSPSSPQGTARVAFNGVRSASGSGASIGRRGLPIVTVVRFAHRRKGASLRGATCLGSYVSRLFRGTVEGVPASCVIVSRARLSSLPHFLSRCVACRSSREVVLGSMVFRVGVGPHLLRLSRRDL